MTQMKSILFDNKELSLKHSILEMDLKLKHEVAQEEYIPNAKQS